jgi:hypothetical protein
MIRRVSRHLGPAVALLLLAAGCAASVLGQDRRALEGPTAEEIFTARVLLSTGRPPSFDEKSRWDEQMDQSISRHLARHPELANAYDVHRFKMLRQVTVGMERELVLLLLGPPVIATKDAGEIEKAARGFWPAVKPSQPTETWFYPQGWRLYLNETRVVDITQYLER